MLVLGETPQKHGLAMSLMERLHQDYTENLKDITKGYHASLVTNFRCHSDITKFCGNLFYNTPLTSEVQSFGTYFSFKFICSNVDLKVSPGNPNTVNKEEAAIVIEEVEELHHKWSKFGEWGAKDCSQICLTSVTRSQVSFVIFWHGCDTYP